MMLWKFIWRRIKNRENLEESYSRERMLHWLLRRTYDVKYDWKADFGKEGIIVEWEDTSSFMKKIKHFRSMLCIIIPTPDTKPDAARWTDDWCIFGYLGYKSYFTYISPSLVAGHILLFPVRCFVSYLIHQNLLHDYSIWDNFKTSRQWIILNPEKRVFGETHLYPLRHMQANASQDAKQDY